jgi:hypothetical protein
MIEVRPRDPGGNDERDPDGVRVVAREKSGGATRLWQGVALLLVSACAGYVLMPSRVASKPNVDVRKLETEALDAQIAAAMEQEKAAAPAKAGIEPDAAAPTPGSASTRSLTPRRTAKQRPGTEPEPGDEEPPELPIPPERLKDVTMGDYIQALHDAGIYEGIGAFNPPGTSPPLEGVEVPEDYQLPEGYVRHYQSTDDGQPIKPILMYSPDYEFLDANGNPVPIPDDRVVPPEHVPPGMPVKPIEIPQPREPGDLGR